MFDFAYAIQILPQLLRAMVITLQATFLGMALALVLGLVWALLRRSRRLWLSFPVAFLVEFIRSTPLLVQMFFLFYVLPGFGVSLSALSTGILALGLHYSAYTSEVYRAGINSVPSGQWEAVTALNFSRWAAWRSIILPQAIPPVIPSLGNYLIAMFKDTPLLSVITVMELLNTAKVLGSESFRYLEPLTLVGILFLLVSLVCAAALRRLEKNLLRVYKP